MIDFSVLTLYHGTNVRFQTIDLHKAKPFKDFGKGFYLTTNYKQAENWAKQKGHFNRKAYVYCYSISDFSIRNFKILELLTYDVRWVDFIARSRMNGLETDYDLIYDRMADNTYKNLSDVLVKYMQKKVSAADVVSEIKWKYSAADQYCFKTERAVECLKLQQVIEIKI